MYSAYLNFQARKYSKPIATDGDIEQIMQKARKLTDDNIRELFFQICGSAKYQHNIWFFSFIKDYLFEKGVMNENRNNQG